MIFGVSTNKEKGTYVMIQSYNNQKGAKIKLWIDEFPNSVINDLHFIKSEMRQSCCEKWDIRKVAIEVSLQKHNSSYGLLGVAFIPYAQGIFEIKVHYNNNDKALYRDTLVYAKDTVFSALPKEYADVVLDEAEIYFNNSTNIPSGELVFMVGAHCKVRSSKALFRALTDILLVFLIKNKKEYTKKEIEEVLKQEDKGTIPLFR